MLTPWPPLTRGLSAKLTGGENVPVFRKLPKKSSAPSDEDYVSAADWGRECPGFPETVEKKLGPLCSRGPFRYFI